MNNPEVFYMTLSGIDLSIGLCFIAIMVLLIILCFKMEKRVSDLNNRMAAIVAAVKSTADGLEFLTETLKETDLIDLDDYAIIYNRYPKLLQQYDQNCYYACENYNDCIANGVYTEYCDRYAPQ